MLLLTGVAAYYCCIYEEEKNEKEETETIEIDDTISPHTNQGLTVEILRIRHRGLMDKLLSNGNSWKNTPSFYWITTVDGKEANSKGNVGEYGIFNDWDTMGKESRTNFDIEEEQKTSEITITIMEEFKTGLFGRKTNDVEQEKINLRYDYRTGRWAGSDKINDKDGYGHYLGETFEIWFNIYQSDIDHDGIPYWTEVNILNTDPGDSDLDLDPDNDGIPTTWEWKWGYDPHTWDDHRHLDPDVDGIENIEEYQMRKYFANPYQPDIYIETDGMQKKGLIDTQHIFFKESQQMIIERYAQHGINVYIDDGWDDGPVNGGGEMLPFIEEIDEVIGGQVLRFYTHNFADERKEIFRYFIVANKLGWNTPCSYNKYDTILMGNGVGPTLKRFGWTERQRHVIIAKGLLHEMGHSTGLMPSTFPGNDITAPIGFRYPNMDPEDYEGYLYEYHSIMNYQYIWRDLKLFDYSDGSNGAPYDQNDWDYIYLPSFQIDVLAYEESIDETFEDFEIVNDYSEPIIQGWEYDEELTTEYAEEFKNLVIVKNADVEIQVFVKTDDAKQNSNRNIRVYAKPQVEPVHAVWSLITEGNTDSNNEITFYSLQDQINTVKEQL